jgi:hypothetical protein
MTDSISEAEYIATSEVAKEGVWIKNFLTELEVVPNISSPINLYHDNTGAIDQSKKLRSHQRSKHVIQWFIREIIDRGDVKINKVNGVENTTNPLTKPLPQALHEMHIASMGIICMSDWLWIYIFWGYWAWDVYI